MSSILKAYRISLHGTPAQKKHLRRFEGSLRWLWNKALATQKERPATGIKYACFGVMFNGPTEWRHAHAHAMDKAAAARASLFRDQSGSLILRRPGRLAADSHLHVSVAQWRGKRAGNWWRHFLHLPCKVGE